ncbi:MAG: 16S rRNA (guanine(527)-N(7))-methyltransferase RsmG [Paracoccaceae bacterium]
MNVFEREIPAWLDVSRETVERLVNLEALVLKWTPTVNLVSRASMAEIWTRHILDSAQIGRLAGAEGNDWVDLGSGGGFPALVVAAMAKEQWPNRRFTLVESDARKAAFLMQAIRSLDLPATVRVARIEGLAPLGADILTARALAPLPDLLAHANRHLARPGRAFFPKGTAHQEEIVSARARWQFDLTLHKSLTDDGAAILEVKNIGPI